VKTRGESRKRKRKRRNGTEVRVGKKETEQLEV